MRVVDGVVLLVCTAIAIGGCQTVQTSSDYDGTFDFTSVGQFSWRPATPEETGDPRIDSSLEIGRIKSAIEAGLRSRGFAFVGEGQGDLDVLFYVSIDPMLRVRTYRDYGGPWGPAWGPWGGWGWGGWGGGWGGSYTEVSQYDERTLIVDFVDPRTGNLIWRGTGRSELGFEGKPEQRTAAMQRVVDSILARFPPSGD